MEERDFFPERLAGQPQILVTQFSEDTIAASLQLALEMRQQGLRVDVYPEPGKYGKQFKYADRKGIRYVILLGPRELELDLVAVKEMESGVQEDVERELLSSWLTSKLLD
jgi:histidyl-tRNA synthetase